MLHVITDLDVGGAERMLANYASRPRSDGVKMVVASIMQPGAMAVPLKDAGVPVVNLGVTRKGLPRLWQLPKAVLRLRRLIRQLEPEAIIGWMYHANLLALQAKRLANFPGKTGHTSRLYGGIRCSAMALEDYPAVFRRVVEASRDSASQFDALVYNSEAGRQEHEALGFTPKASVVARNGIDTKRFAPNADNRARVRAALGIESDAKVAITAARVDPMKDYPGYLKALAKLDDPPTVIVAGKDTDDDNKIPPMPNMHRLGVRNDVADLLTAADFIIMPSAYGEGFPNALAEGMACGLVPITTDVGDAAAIAGDTGWVVARRDPDALAMAIETAMSLNDNELADRKTAARHRIETEFSLDVSCKRMDEAFGI